MDIRGNCIDKNESINTMCATSNVSPLLEFASLNGGLSPPFFYKPTFIDSIFILVALSIF